MFLLIILGATDGRAPKGFAPLAIGLGLTLIHLVGIPVTNLSVNPALAQLWLFWVAPRAGGVLGGVAYRWLAVGPEEPVVGEAEPPVRAP